MACLESSGPIFLMFEGHISSPFIRGLIFTGYIGSFSTVKCPNSDPPPLPFCATNRKLLTAFCIVHGSVLWGILEFGENQLFVSASVCTRL